jgi:hypothetical protein
MLVGVAVADQRVNGGVGDLVIVTSGIRTSLAARVNGFFCDPTGSSVVRTVRLIGPPLWRVRLLRRDSVCNRPACAGRVVVDQWPRHDRS